MARFGFGGFEFAGTIPAEGLTQIGSGGGTAHVTSPVRSGTRSRRLTTLASGTTDIAWALGVLGAAGVTYYGKVWVNFDALPSSGSIQLAGLTSSAVSPAIGAGLRLNADGTMTFTGPGGVFATSAGTYATNTWHCLEVRCVSYGVLGASPGQGTWAEVRVDGATIGSYRNVSGTSGFTDNFRFGCITPASLPNAFNIYFDDWAVNDDTGSANNSWVGTSEACALLLPVADNTIGTNWKLGNNTTPSANAYDSVNNLPPTGKALASGLAGDQLRNGVTPTGVAADEFAVDVQSPTEAGVPAGSTITAAFALALAGSSVTTLQVIGLQVTANPVIAEDTDDTPAAVAGTFNTNWGRVDTPISDSPSVALGTRPTTKVRYATRGGTGTALVCGVGMYVAYVPGAPPTATVTSPATGALVAGMITVTADTTGGAGGVTQVELLVDGTSVATDTSSPWSFSLDTTTLTDGTHTLAARATDTISQTATSAAITVTVDNAGPTVAITDPATGASVSGVFTVTATATDPHSIDHVELLVDGVTVGTDSASPYTFTLNAATLVAGSHSLVARAFDSLGNPSDSLAVSITVAGVPPGAGALRVRERPPLRVSLDVETPSGRRYRWAPDDPRPENIPSGLRWSSTMPGGYESLDTTLPRRPGVDYRDLDRLSTIRVRDAGGGNVGEYRLERAPRVSGDRMAISPSAVGWQAHLEDDKSAREIYVDRDMTAWSDAGAQRVLQLAAAGWSFTGPQQRQDSTTSTVVTGFADDWGASPLPRSEAWYDARGIPLASLYFEWRRRDGNVNDADAAWNWQAFLSDDDTATVIDQTGGLRAAGPGSGLLLATTQTRSRAMLLLNYTAGPAGAAGTQYELFWESLGVYGAHGLPSRGEDPPGVYASDVVAHAVGKWAPLLVVTAESITPSSFVIAHLVFKDPTTAAEIVRGATRYGLQDWAVWDDKTFWWHPRGEHSRNWRARVGPAGLEETGPQLDRLWESVIVAYQDVDGSTRTVGPPGSGANVESADLKDSDPDNPANQLGIIRRDLLQMGVATAASATEVGRRFLEESQQLDTSGRARIVGHVEDDHGVLFPYHAIRAGDTITFLDASDPSPRRIVRAAHSADERACDVDLDSPSEGLAALLERLQVVLVPLGL